MHKCPLDRHLLRCNKYFYRPQLACRTRLIGKGASRAVRLKADMFVGLLSVVMILQFRVYIEVPYCLKLPNPTDPRGLTQKQWQRHQLVRRKIRVEDNVGA